MKTNQKSRAVIFLIAVILCSCSPKETTIPLIDLTNHSGGRLLHLDELMTDIRVVRLETSPEILVPENYQSVVGEKNILILGENAILQFDIEGNFVRTLAKQGKGPGEFIYMHSYDLNDEESKLYMYDNRKQLLVYNLNTGDLLKGISLPYHANGFSLAKDHIVCQGRVFSSLEFFTVTYEGQLLDTVPTTSRTNILSYASRYEYLKYRSRAMYYMNVSSDTVCQWDGIQESAVYNVQVNNRYNSENNSVGNIPSIRIQTATKIFFAKLLFNVEHEGGGVSARAENIEYYLWDIPTRSIEPISGYYHDFFEIEVEDLYVATFGNVMHLSYSAIDFKDLLAKAMDNKNLDPPKAVELENLDQSISMEDNPVYLIGQFAN